MTDELIEQVARAICKAHKIDCGLPESAAEYEASHEWIDWSVEAQAAIAAMQPRFKAERIRGGEMVKEAAADWFADRFSDAVQADCESGVKWLNERAAKAYLKDAPDTLAAIREGEEAIRALSVPAIVEAGDA